MQKQFSQALFAPNPEQRNRLLEDIQGQDNSERNQRLNIYRNNVFVSLMTALGDIFPVCKQVVGEDFFNAMGRQFVERHPPKSPVLTCYGDEFSEFVTHFFPAQSLPYLAELCDLEYRLLQLTHAAEPATLSLEAAQQSLSQVQHPERLELHLSPLCTLLRTGYRVGSLFLAHQTNKYQVLPTLEQIDIHQAECLLFTKRGLYGQVYVLTEAEFAFVEALQTHPSLSRALPSQEDFDLGQTLAKLMTWQMFTAIKESKEPLC
ncbi:putative DNA-binding domain-containing protein [Rhodanobacter aciditrophus]|uniref:DNA-binding domain-containing protein n=1 Tax=Rhodanobacter aciditrophus TaxID=1623218 RepID=A0ABW4AZR7_9GAMM